MLELDWLPESPDWQQSFDQARHLPPAETLDRLRSLADTRLDLARTNRLDKALHRTLAHLTVPPAGWTPIRLAILGSSTLTHLLPSIRVAGLRRNVLIEICETPYGTYRQELAGLADPASPLRTFNPTALLLALDTPHLAALGSSDAALETLRSCWTLARQHLSCAIIQQTALPTVPTLLGHQEHLLPESPAALIDNLNAALRPAAEADGIALLALDHIARDSGLRQWHDPALWFRAKQEVHPAAAPLYGDHVARILAALLGQSKKCLVLDLDNTLWGGVIGDDGLDNIVLGQGSPAGEAHLALQRYALALQRRGIILAVCSKNDHANALAPFERHPEMLLRPADIACFVANWDDKAANLRHIARTLNLGLDGLVFVDDNPAERALIRRELPTVAVPEMPADIALYVPTLAAAGYFESLGITADDRSRAALYAANTQRAAALAASVGGSESASATDIESFLASLQMQLQWNPFDAANQTRIVQLINKTNQFNLTTRRVTQPEIAALAVDPDTLALQFRLRDTFGDNGTIGIILARPATTELLRNAGFPKIPTAPTDLYLDLFLMSCRVLGRQVEEAMLNILAEQAQLRGATRLLGHYIPTPKNAMVANLYSHLGFIPLETTVTQSTVWSLNLSTRTPHPTQITSTGA